MEPENRSVWMSTPSGIPHIHNRSLWFRGRESQDLASEYIPLGEHAPRCVTLHRETNKAAVGFDGVVVSKLCRDEPLYLIDPFV